MERLELQHLHLFYIILYNILYLAQYTFQIIPFALKHFSQILFFFWEMCINRSCMYTDVHTGFVVRRNRDLQEREVIYVWVTEGILYLWRVTHSALSAAARPQSEGHEPVDNIACVFPAQHCRVIDSRASLCTLLCVCGTFLFLCVSSWQMDRNTVKRAWRGRGQLPFSQETTTQPCYFVIFFQCLFIWTLCPHTHTRVHTCFLIHQCSTFILNKQFLHSAYCSLFVQRISPHN